MKTKKMKKKIKNIEKKWLLFVLATCITVCGVSYTLIKNTYASGNENVGVTLNERK